MPGTYSKLVTVITGQTITAAERNNEFDNVINNMTPTGVDDASANLAAMQATIDPAGGSLATDLAGELKRLRFQILKLGTASGNWYDALPFLAGITPAAAGATGTDLNNRLAQLASQIKNLSGATNWYDALTAALLKAGGTMAGPIAMGGTNKITGLAAATTAGDALRYEQVVGLYLLLTGGTLSDNLVFSPTTKGVKGTTTNDSADAGNVGQYVEATGVNVSVGSTGAWADMANISLTAGDWSVSHVAMMDNNGGGVSSENIGISVTSGNFNTGLVSGSNWVACVPGATTPASLTIASYRMSLSGTTTVYAKHKATYGGVVLWNGRLSARRLR
jgi:hypothetical protein